jgi:hypothetical protein
MALSPNTAELSSKLQEELGIPKGFRVWSPMPFGGMDQQASRSGMADTDFFVLENLIRTGPGKLRSCWDIGAAIYSPTLPLTIVSHFGFNIGATIYEAVFLSDGTAVQVNIATLAVTVISSVPGTFYKGGILPACVQSGSQYLLIASNITPNSYWIWDGAILYTAGSIGPVVTLLSGGSGYSSAPGVTAFGGSGSGVVATAVIANGTVVAVIISNQGVGYHPGDVVQFAFSGGGSDTGAIITAVLTAAKVDHVSLLAGGSGYAAGTYALAFSGAGGATGTYTVDATGAVVSIFLSASGAGYTDAPAVTFPSGGGSGALAAAFLAPTTVASYSIVNGGTGFGVAPTLVVSGGGGSGATATTTLTTGSISAVTPGVAGTGYTSAPAVTIQSGVNSAAAATATVMPFGVSGAAIETFSSRVFLPFPNQSGKQNNGGVFLVSAPGSLTDFATSDGGLIFTSTDRFLRVNYSAMRQANGFLYPFGDSSVSVISNVQTAGSPPATTFNYQNTDPQIGTSWRDTLQDYGRTVLFANPLGVFGLYGGAVTKISSKIDEIFNNAIFPPTPGALLPSAAVAEIFSIRVYLLLMTILDPVTKAQRNVMLAWDEKEWFIVSQSSALIYISTQEVGTIITAWGTDGTTLRPLLSVPSATLQKRLVSKHYGASEIFLQKTALAFYAQGQDRSAAQAGVTLTGTVDTDSNQSFAMPNTMTFPAPNPAGDGLPAVAVFAQGSGDIVGFNLGFTVVSTSPDFTIENLALAYQHQGSVFG